MLKYVHCIVIIVLLVSSLSVFSSPTYAAATFPFTEDFEADTLSTVWSTSANSSGVVQKGELYPHRGSGSVFIGQASSATNTAASLILSVDLAGQTDVYLDFWFRTAERASNDANGVYISDNSGETWVQIRALDNNSVSYSHTVMNVAALAAAKGKVLNSTFRIRFSFYSNIYQPRANHGLVVDDIRLTNRAAQIVSFPMETQTFEDAELPQGWFLVNRGAGGAEVNDQYPYRGQRSLSLTQPRSDDGRASLVLLVDLTNQSQVYLDFYWRETDHRVRHDRAIFISDDDGENYVRVRNLPNERTNFRHEVIDIAAAARRANVVLNDRFQILIRHDAPSDSGNPSSNGQPGDGIIIDNFRLSATNPLNLYIPLLLR
jgi:hypothetical protein